jgi:hypothetical protein
MKQNMILKSLKHDQVALKAYGVQSLSIFGSYARDQAHKASDIDILVSFNKPISLFGFLKLKDHLEGVLGHRVDLVTEQALHPRLRDTILKEKVNVL